MFMITVESLTVEQLAQFRTLLPDERIAYLAELNGNTTDNAAEYENAPNEYGVRLTSFTLPKTEIKLGAFVGVVGSNGKVGYIRRDSLITLASGVKNGTVKTLAKTVKDGCATYSTADPELTFSFYESTFEDGQKRFVVGPRAFLPSIVTKGATV
jgi:uncharacterized membrane protein (UPF0136 family)